MMPVDNTGDLKLSNIRLRVFCGDTLQFIFRTKIYISKVH